MRRAPVLVATALAALTAAATLAGCAGGPSDPPGTVTLSFLSYNYGTPDLGGAGTQELLDGFARTHPTIHVVPRGVAVKDTLVALRTGVAGGSPDDVAQVGWSKMAEAYASLPVVPVQDLAGDQWPQATAGMNPAVMRATARDGRTVAMPYTMSIPTLFYDDQLFRRAGLDPDRPPRTMAELRDAALRIKATGAEGVYVDAANASKSDFLTQSLVNSAGGSVVAPGGRVAVDDPPAVTALDTLGDLTRSGAQPGVSEDDALAAFKGGHLGMLVTSTAVLAGLDAAAAGSFTVRTAALPTYGTAPARPTYSGAGLVVLSQDPAKQRAAWELVRYLTSPESMATIATKIGYLPLRPIPNPDPRLAPALAQLDTVAPYQFFPGAKANQAVVALQDRGVTPIALRGADARQSLTAAADAIRRLGP